MVRPIELLNLYISDDVSVDLISRYDLSIKLEIDLNNENMPDVYWVDSTANGFLLKGDENRRYTSVFCYFNNHENHKNCTLLLEDISSSSTIENLVSNFGNPSRAGTFNGKNWIKYEYDDHHLHFLFSEGKLLTATYSVK